MEFFIPLEKIPTATHQEKKVRVVKGKPIFYEPEPVANARALYMAMLSKHVPQEKIDGAIRLTTKWIFYRCVSQIEWKTTKPDTDNMIKLLKDCMTKLGYWKDDSQVASEITEKFWSPIKTYCGIYIKIESLGEIEC